MKKPTKKKTFDPKETAKKYSDMPIKAPGKTVRKLVTTKPKPKTTPKKK